MGAWLVAHWDEMLGQMGFGNDDVRRLRALWPYVVPHIDQLVDDYLHAVLHGGGSSGRRIDPAQTLRTRKRLCVLLEDTLLGPHDSTYWMHRQEAARAFVRMGSPLQWIFLANQAFNQSVVDIARLHLSADEAWLVRSSVDRITTAGMAAFSTTYMRSHEAQELRSLQELIVRNMPVTVLCLDEQGHVTAATRPSASLFGDPARHGQHYEDFLPPLLLEAADLPSQVGRALATSEEVVISHVSIGEGPNARSFRIHVVPLEHELARILLHIEELTDVVGATARAQHAEALARIGSLAANLAHEIRNPLTAISTTLQVITTSFDQTDRRRAVIEKVNDQVFRLDRLVSDLLAYARPAQPRMANVSLADIAHEAASSISPPAEVLIRGPVIARGDRELILQILFNLLHNAQDAADPQASVLIEVGPGVEIVVRDNGSGVPNDLVERLFTPFLTTKAKGTGLGLAISRKLAEAMQGNLTLDLPNANAPLKGASFRLSLLAQASQGRVFPTDTAEHTG